VRVGEGVEWLRAKHLLRKVSRGFYQIPQYVLIDDGTGEVDRVVYSPPRNGGRITTAKRNRIYTRDGHRCVLCGATENLTLDHIKPKALKGTNHDANLQTMCATCNNAKGANYEEPLAASAS